MPLTAIRLEFDPQKGALVLEGAGAGAVRNPLFASYIRQVKGTVCSDGLVCIPTAEEAVASTYQALVKILARIGLEVKAAGEATDILNRAENEARRFDEFSKKANDIWHRQIDAENFQSFVEVVEKACPGRVFYRKQLLAAFHMAFSQNACNFSVPGAGKTSVVYAAYAYLKSLPPGNEKHVSRLLIVGPLASFKAWEDEYRGIFARTPSAKRISGSMSATDRAGHLRGLRYGSRETEITLTSYPTLAASQEDFRAYLDRPDKPTMMVLDEAHYIKRDDGVWASAVLALAPFVSARVVLTGTPAPNGYEDLWNLFRFIYPDRQIVGFPISSLRAMSDGAMPKAIPELKARIQPFYTRIRKVDLNLPSVVEKRVEVPMMDVHERIYRSIERRIVPQLRKEIDNPSAPLRVKARLIRLRQACVNPELLLKPLDEDGLFDASPKGDFSISELEVIDLIKGFDANHGLVRVETCRQLVSRILHEQGKVLIWSYFLGNLSLIHEALRGVASFIGVLTGATPVSKDGEDEDSVVETRERIIDRFHTVPGTAILVANPQAVGESISLHKACRTAIFFDRDFNAGRFIQSKDRIHRYNPNGGHEVTYYYLVSPGTVDEDIDGRLVIKEKRLSQLVDAEEVPLFTAGGDDDTDDINAILKAYERRKTI